MPDTVIIYKKPIWKYITKTHRLRCGGASMELIVKHLIDEIDRIVALGTEFIEDNPDIKRTLTESIVKRVIKIRAGNLLGRK